MRYQLKVKGPRGEEKIVDLCETEEQMQKVTVLHLKKKISQQLNISDDIRMVFRTDTLEESDLLSVYNIKHMSTIHTLLMLPGGHRWTSDLEEGKDAKLHTTNTQNS